MEMFYCFLLCFCTIISPIICRLFSFPLLLFLLLLWGLNQESIGKSGELTGRTEAGGRRQGGLGHEMRRAREDWAGLDRIDLGWDWTIIAAHG